jgi:GT2 family glycosyltransferase/polyhydroxyalkanoate synthesis regulator phasin
MQTSVIVLSWNGVDYLADCLNAVLAQDYPDFEVIVVDNGSTDGSADLVAESFPEIRLIRNERNLGFAAGNNVALWAAKGDMLVLLNQDTVVHEGWLAALAAALRDPSVGVAGCKMLYADGTIQHAGAYLHGSRGETGHIGQCEQDTGQYDEPRDVDFVTGASIAFQRSTLVKAGPFDEGFGAAYYEDVDWCYRVRELGLRVVYWPAATLIHFESVSSDVGSYAHHVLFHHGRLRLLYKHKPLTWLREELFKAESDWIRRFGGTIELTAARDAYLRVILALPEILAFRLRPVGVASGRNAREEWDGLLRLASDLRTACVDEMAKAGSSAQSFDDEGELTESPAVRLWQDLLKEWQVHEQPFRSTVPFVGKGIAAFREAWNNVSTRWYVLPLLQQQNAFNHTVLRLMQQMQQDIAQHMREVDRLTLAIARLERSVQALEEPDRGES